MKQRFKIATLGCRTNQYESQAYRDQLIAMGFEEAADHEIADLCLVNSCTVTDSADQKSRQQIKSLIKRNPGAKVVVTGCLVESAPELSTQIGGIQVVQNKIKQDLIRQIFPDAEEFPEFKITHFEGHTRAFIKIQDGCNSFCSYCIIPYVRGRSRSRSMDDILSEARGLIDNGFKEIVLTGINIGDFNGNVPRGEAKIPLSEVVKKIDAMEGLLRLRISSIDPDEVEEDLAAAILEGAHTAPSLHLVLQSGSQAILKRMNRKYTLHHFLSTVDRLRDIRPDFSFTTDVIVGFPGETEEDFKATLDMIRRVQFTKVHMFPYSVRAGTRAALFPDQVPKSVIEERKNRLLHEAEQVAFAWREQFVGKILHLLIERIEDGFAYGHSEHFLELKVKQQPHWTRNMIVPVLGISNDPLYLIGEPAYASARD